MAFSGVTFENQNVSSKSDGRFYQAFGTDGIVQGCSMSVTSSTLVIQPGTILMGGRLVELDSATTIDLSSELSSDGYLQIYEKIDLTQPATSTSFQQLSTEIEFSTTTTFPALTKEAINFSGNIYEMELAVVKVESGAVTELTSKLGCALTQTWTNVAVTAGGWSSDSTVTGYSYKQTLSLSGCTADMMVIVPPFSGSGSLAAECNTVAGGLEIWSNSNSLALTIPIIKRVI